LLLSSCDPVNEQDHSCLTANIALQGSLMFCCCCWRCLGRCSTASVTDLWVCSWFFRYVVVWIWPIYQIKVASVTQCQHPILFLLYTVDLVKVVQSCGLSVHLYADEFKYTSFVHRHLSTCCWPAYTVANWMSSNRLRLNAIKTEFLWCTSARRQCKLCPSPFRVCSDHVTPSTFVRDLAIYLDSDVSMRSKVLW